MCLASCRWATQYIWGKFPCVCSTGWVACRALLDTAKFLEFEPRSSPMVHGLVTRVIQVACYDNFRALLVLAKLRYSNGNLNSNMADGHRYWRKTVWASSVNCTISGHTVELRYRTVALPSDVSCQELASQVDGRRMWMWQEIPFFSKTSRAAVGHT